MVSSRPISCSQQNILDSQNLEDYLGEPGRWDAGPLRHDSSRKILRALHLAKTSSDP